MTSNSSRVYTLSSLFSSTLSLLTWVNFALVRSWKIANSSAVNRISLSKPDFSRDSCKCPKWTSGIVPKATLEFKKSSFQFGFNIGQRFYKFSSCWIWRFKYRPLLPMYSFWIKLLIPAQNLKEINLSEGTQQSCDTTEEYTSSTILPLEMTKAILKWRGWHFLSNRYHLQYATTS